MKNDKKQLCAKCKYAARAATLKYGGGHSYFHKFKDETAIICDYIGYTGRSRMLICDAEDCTVYEPRRRSRK